MSTTNLLIGIKGGYGNGNFGDDALMLVAHAVVRDAFPTSEIVFIGRDAPYIKRFLPDSRILGRGNANENNCDLLVYGGGTQFYSFPGIRRSLAIRIIENARRPLQLAQKVVRRFAKADVPPLGKEVFGLGIGAGPFIENHPSIEQTGHLLKSMRHISVRDIASFDFCQASGCRNVTLRSDLCYLPGFWESFGVSSAPSNHRSMKKIGIIVRDWPHTRQGDSYATPVLEVAKKLRVSGKEVSFITFKRSDRIWGKRLSENGENAITWNPEEQTVAEFLELLSRFNLFITARYHGAVFASILRKPVVCIEVEQKLRLVSELLEGGSRLWSYPFQVSECIRLISDIETKYGQVVDELNTSVRTQNSLAELMAKEFRIAASLGKNAIECRKSPLSD